MRRRLLAILVVASLVASCQGPAVSQSPGPSGAAPTGVLATPSAAAGAWLRLDWQAVDPPGIPAYPYRLNIASSDRGLLVRTLERPDSPSISVLTTTDGRTWHSASAAPGVPMGQSVDGGADWLEIALTEDGKIDLVASTDGITWEQRSRFPEVFDRVGLAAVRGRTIVACGTQKDMTVSIETCAVSTDEGRTWRHLPELDPIIASGKFLGVTATTQGFLLTVRKDVRGVVMGGGASSADGVAWSTLPDAPGLEALAPDIAPRIAAFKDRHLIIGAVREGREYISGLWTSADGQAWQRVALPRVVAWAGRFCVLRDAVVALAINGVGDAQYLVRAFVSGDGRTWRSDDLPPGVTAEYEWKWRIKTEAGKGVLLVSAELGRAFLGSPAATSDPGPTPAPPATAQPEPTGAEPPTVTWQSSEVYPVGHVADVTAWSGGLIGVGYTDSDEEGLWPAIWTSPDGLNWARAAAPRLERTRFTAVAARGDLTVVAGIQFTPFVSDDKSWTGVFWWSRDGRTWHRAPDNADLRVGVVTKDDQPETGIFDLAAGGPGFVAVGARSEGGDAVATAWASADGNAWRRTATLGAGVLHGLAVVMDGLLAVGETGGQQSAARVWATSNAIDWNPVSPLPAGTAGSISARGATVLAGAFERGPAIWLSIDAGLTWLAAPDQPALAAQINDERISTVLVPPWALIAGGLVSCSAHFAGCPAAWVSADGRRWSRAELPLENDAQPTQMIPLTSTLSGDRVVLVGGYDALLGLQGWRTWVGTQAP